VCEGVAPHLQWSRSLLLPVDRCCLAVVAHTSISSAYAQRWSAAQVWRRSSRDRMVHIIESLIIPKFGPQPLAALRRSEVQGGAFVVIACDALEQPARRHCPANARTPRPLGRCVRPGGAFSLSGSRFLYRPEGRPQDPRWLGGPYDPAHKERERSGPAEAPAPSKKQVWGPHNNGVG
jgi:hypothetical protein